MHLHSKRMLLHGLLHEQVYELLHVAESNRLQVDKLHAGVWVRLGQES